MHDGSVQIAEDAMSAAVTVLDDVADETRAASLTSAVREGLPVGLVDDVVASGLLTAAEIDRLVVPRKTLSHR
jgi:hypothetical protein